MGPESDWPWAHFQLTPGVHRGCVVSGPVVCCVVLGPLGIVLPFSAIELKNLSKGNSIMEHVEAFLKHIGLGQYAGAFENNGYDSLDMFFVMDDSDFAIFGPYVGMLPGHLQRLRRTVYSMKKECARAWERFCNGPVDSNVGPNANNTVASAGPGLRPAVG